MTVKIEVKPATAEEIKQGEKILRAKKERRKNEQRKI